MSFIFHCLIHHKVQIKFGALFRKYCMLVRIHNILYVDKQQIDIYVADIQHCAYLLIETRNG